MGVIKRQGIKHSIVRYLSVMMGAVNTIFLFPLFLGDVKLGLINFLIQTSFTFHVFSLLGISGVLIKFFPEFKEEDKDHNGLFTFSVLWTFVGFILLVLVCWLFKPLILAAYQDKSEYLPLIIPAIFSLSFYTLFTSYAHNFRRIVVPAIFEQAPKFVLPILAALFFFNWIPFNWVVYGLISFYAIMAIGMAFYIRWLGQWKWTFNFSFFDKPLLKRIFVYAGFSVLSSLGATLAWRIDTMMVASMLDWSNTGIYTFALFIASVIKIPADSIRFVSSSIISENIATNDLQNVKEIYKKSSIILWTVGLFLLMLIWLNLDSLFAIMPKGDIFGKGKYVVLILGIGILVDLLTSVNGEIIAYSPYYRFQFYALLFLGGVNITANLILIPEFKILGAAMATASSLILFNIAKVVFIYTKYKMLPFSPKSLWVLMVTVMIYAIVSFFSFTTNPFLTIIINSALASCLFLSTIFYLKISEDINEFALQIWNKAKAILRL